MFRLLTKPCPPQQLRDTIELAAKLARATPTTPAATETELTAGDTVEIILEADAATEVTAQTEARTAATTIIEKPQFEAPAAAPRTKLATGLGIVVFSTDNEVIECVQKAVRARLPVYTAGNIVHVVKCLTEHRPGVLVTDVSQDKTTIQSMTARLKEHLPELVTIAVSQHRDVHDMLWLINHGQIFRFLRKPLSAGRTAISLQAALQHHRLLLENPELIKRHEVDASAASDSGVMEGMLSKLKNLKRLWTST